jgi:hypothetical protein
MKKMSALGVKRTWIKTSLALVSACSDGTSATRVDIAFARNQIADEAANNKKYSAQSVPVLDRAQICTRLPAFCG